MDYSKEQLRQIYEQMVTGRKFEEKALSLVTKGIARGFYHLSIGQEAAQVGAVSAMGPEDYLCPTHRFHPGLVNRMDKKDLAAELIGKAAGICHGKAFTFHIASVKDKVLPLTGMLGGTLPIATGFAWSLKQEKKDGVVLCAVGDGATAEGDVHEAMNLASLFKCPIVFFIENNKWGVSTPVSKASVLENLSDKGKAYNMPGVTVDGNDVLQVREAVDKAIEMARKGQPNIVEAKTHRWRGHFEGDPHTYWDEQYKKELAEVMQNDPLKRYTNYLLDHQYITLDELNDMNEKVQTTIEGVFEYALSLPEPTREETLDYDQVYATNLGGALI
ncbi:MAG TPA: thiamine pyrophosphate-dependent dehydrogenase E1 component subunit alpha [Anaerovoracaceae bacterium]|nr:thiamine pyrophosphate-dependent dehydrogenase E1 component subunit alpha [Anaerovoracaceae bacterium]